MINGNAPAYPLNEYAVNIQHCGGLTIRQEFAARFMQAMLTQPECYIPIQIPGMACDLADALIAELNKTESNANV